MPALLKINNVSVCLNNILDNNLNNSGNNKNNKIIKNLSLSIDLGQVHAIMGPNGSGKSSLAYAIMGHPNYKVTDGNVLFLGKNLEGVSVDKRAKKGIFLAFQNPYEIPGATVFSILKELYSKKIKKLVSVIKFSDILYKNMDMLKISHSFAYRSLNEGFSGGEKKKFEILQMLILEPKLVILDEIDSGLDIDSLKIVSQAIMTAKKKNPDMSIVIITHYHRILKYIIPDFVHIMYKGRIARSGDASLVQDLESQGYDKMLGG